MRRILARHDVATTARPNRALANLPRATTTACRRIALIAQQRVTDIFRIDVSLGQHPEIGDAVPVDQRVNRPLCAPKGGCNLLQRPAIADKFGQGRRITTWRISRGWYGGG